MHAEISEKVQKSKGPIMEAFCRIKPVYTIEMKPKINSEKFVFF